MYQVTLHMDVTKMLNPATTRVQADARYKKAQISQSFLQRAFTYSVNHLYTHTSQSIPLLFTAYDKNRWIIDIIYTCMCNEEQSRQ